MLHRNKIVSLTLLIIFTLVALFIVADNPVLASDLVEDSWSIKAPMSQARAGLGVTVVNGKIYAIGGYISDRVVNVNERYDPVDDTWVTLKSMPTSRYHFVVAAYQGKIYCIGGGINDKDNNWISCNKNEVYDISTDSWSTKASIPHNGTCVQAYVLDGKIFVVIHHYDDGTFGTYALYLYNPATDSWTKESSMPRPDDIGMHSDVYYSFSVAMNNKIMIYYQYYGSVPDTPFKGTVTIYDIQTSAWSNKEANPDVPSPPRILSGEIRSAGKSWITTGVYAPKKVYVLGLPQNNVYDPVVGTWATFKNMPTASRREFGVAVVDDLVYVMGGFILRDSPQTGYPPGEFSTLNEQYIPIDYHDTPIATSLPATPEPSVSSKSFLTTLTVATMILSAGITTIGLVLFHKKKSQLKKN
jgi:N-acetylneuraminic acid mutarotase